MAAGLVPFIHGSPGIGKSSVLREIAKEADLTYIDHRMSTSAPEDMSGLPTFKDGMAKFAPFEEIFPLKDHSVQKGNGWLLSLDEFNSAPRSVMAAAYKLILDRQVGQYDLHPNLYIVAAGNLATDRAITVPMGTAMQSRMVHIEVYADQDEWIKDVAIADSFDSRIIAYLSQYPHRLMDFTPDHTDKTFCSPRTWEFVNKLLKVFPSNGPITPEKIPLLAGTITSGVAVDFANFTRVYDKLYTIETILGGPETLPIPTDTSVKWATIVSMAENTNVENVIGLSKFANRFEMSFRVLYFRMAIRRNPMIRSHPDMIAAIVELQKYLYD